jgi:hypothetical protein
VDADSRFANAEALVKGTLFIVNEQHANVVLARGLRYLSLSLSVLSFLHRDKRRRHVGVMLLFQIQNDVEKKNKVVAFVIIA